MNTFIIDEKVINKAWGADSQYWIKLSDYSILEDYSVIQLVVPDEFNKDDILDYSGIIPFYNIKRHELSRAYVKTIDNAKLQEKFDKLEDCDVVEYFWKCCHAYPYLFDRIESFQREYILNGLIKWCEEKGINYEVKL